MRRFSDFRFWLLGVFATAVAVYIPALGGAAIWDDIPLISGATPATWDLLSAFTKPFGNYYRPLTSASFSLENSVFHGQPLFYHATNIALHAFTAVLVAVLAFSITQKKVAGVLAGLFFAVQPMQVAAIAWIGGRTDALSAFFLTALLVSLIRYHRTEKRTWLAMALILYLLAALTKEQAAAMLPAAPLSAFVFGSKGWKEFWRLAAMFGAVFVLYIGMWVVGGPMPHAGSSDPSSTVLFATRTAAYYFLAFIFPNRTSMISFTLANNQGIVWVLVGATVIVTFAYLFAKVWKAARHLAWIGICGLLVYLPISNCPRVPSFVVGPFRCAEMGIAVACLFGIALEYMISKKQLIWVGALSANFIAGTAVTIWGIQQWLTPLGFFGDVVRNDPHFVIGVQLEAHYLNESHHYREAEYLTSSALVWVFNTPRWAEIVDRRKKAAVTPDVRQRLMTNTGIPQVKELSGLMAIHAMAAAGSAHLDHATLAAKDALAFMPNDPFLKSLLDLLRRQQVQKADATSQK